MLCMYSVNGLSSQGILPGERRLSEEAERALEEKAVKHMQLFVFRLAIMFDIDETIENARKYAGCDDIRNCTQGVQALKQMQDDYVAAELKGDSELEFTILVMYWVQFDRDYVRQLPTPIPEQEEILSGPREIGPQPMMMGRIGRGIAALSDCKKKALFYGIGCVNKYNASHCKSWVQDYMQKNCQ